MACLSLRWQGQGTWELQQGDYCVAAYFSSGGKGIEGLGVTLMVGVWCGRVQNGSNGCLRPCG